MTMPHDTPAASAPVTSPGRRDAVRSLMGMGAAGVALLGGAHAASAGPTSEESGPAGPDYLGPSAEKKKKRGKRGPTGPTGPAGNTIVRDSDDFAVAAGTNQNGQVNCPSGDVVGGGVSVNDTDCRVVASAPVGTTAWGATVFCPDASTMTVSVICLE